MPRSDAVELPFPAAALQPPAAGTWRDWRVGAGWAQGSLRALTPSAKPLSQGSKAEDQARVLTLAREIDELQNLFYADGR